MTKVYSGFYSNELVNVENGEHELITAMNGNWHSGHTIMYYDDLEEGVKGCNAVLDVVLKELLNHKQALEDGQTVDVHVEWTLSEDKSNYTSCKLVTV